MPKIDDRVSELFEEFKDLPRPYLVRSSHVGDAFSLFVYEALLQDYHGIRRLTKQDLSELRKSVVPPPDDGIDIFYEESNMDERRYHIVQCKYESLDAVSIGECFGRMKETIESYARNPGKATKYLKRVISDTDFDEEQLESCIYYVVHAGPVNSTKYQKENCKVINGPALEALFDGIVDRVVPQGEFELDTANNFIVNNFVDNDRAEVNPNVPKSILCNLSGYDLAVLDQRYSQSESGRNILYGGNLRESLSKKSKTFAQMKLTIDNEPELFLYYNNGITIIAERFNSKRDLEIGKKETIRLRKFSIINGAQTTSTLGSYLRQAKDNGDQDAIDKLKKVLVLTKIYEINPSLEDHDNISRNVKIFNNTQTPLSSRDMVSIRPEQNKLQNRFLDGVPPIFIYIRKGETRPASLQLKAYQEITNEALAQLCLCAFFFEPHTATAKKVRLFDSEAKPGVLLNETYERLFDPTKGVLFEKSSDDIDELLFVFKLHVDAQKFFRKKMNDDLSDRSQAQLRDGETEKDRELALTAIRRNIDIANKSLFFDIATYYKLRSKYDSRVKKIERLSFDTDRYLADEEFRTALLKGFSELVFNRTINVIRKATQDGNVYNWLREKDNQSIYFNELENDFNGAFDLGQDYRSFVEKFKVAVT